MMTMRQSQQRKRAVADVIVEVASLIGDYGLSRGQRGEIV